MPNNRKFITNDSTMTKNIFNIFHCPPPPPIHTCLKGGIVSWNKWFCIQTCFHHLRALNASQETPKAKIADFWTKQLYISYFWTKQMYISIFELNTCTISYFSLFIFKGTVLLIISDPFCEERHVWLNHLFFYNLI